MAKPVKARRLDERKALSCITVISSIERDLQRINVYVQYTDYSICVIYMSLSFSSSVTIVMISLFEIDFFAKKIKFI